MGLREAELLAFPSVTALLRRGADWLTGVGGVAADLNVPGPAGGSCSSSEKQQRRAAHVKLNTESLPPD